MEVVQADECRGVQDQGSDAGSLGDLGTPPSLAVLTASVNLLQYVERGQEWASGLVARGRSTSAGRHAQCAASKVALVLSLTLGILLIKSQPYHRTVSQLRHARRPQRTKAAFATQLTICYWIRLPVRSLPEMGLQPRAQRC